MLNTRLNNEFMKYFIIYWKSYIIKNREVYITGNQIDKYCKHYPNINNTTYILCYITINAQIERHDYVNKAIIENINITNNRITNIPHWIITNDRKITLV